ncbi:MAG: hypothetical protein DRJ65_05535 [Acidobacteria bacterium]|nr:MAG: hypothetical protein DRJ65_05535 [Acidobacteriota bacterium]
MPGSSGPGRQLSPETRLILVAAGDDLLLEDAFRDATERAVGGMPEAAVETLSDDVTPEDVALELNSPSLFNPERVLLVPDISQWVVASTSPGGPKIPSRKDAKGVDALVQPLLSALEDGMPDGVALVMGVWCGAKPTGSLVTAVEDAGHLDWIATPEPPKPWEDCAVSDAQKTVLRRLRVRAAPDARFAPAAEALLFERLGFAPRRLVQETVKLSVAAGPDALIDEALVRRLVLPLEGSLEKLQDAILGRDIRTAVTFLDEGRRGLPIRDWSGGHIDDGALGIRVFNLAIDTFTRMLYLRGAARAIGAEDELNPQKNSARSWYSQTFKPRLGPKLKSHIEADPGAPFRSGPKGKTKTKAPTPWAMQRLFRGASLYSDEDLIRSLIEAGQIERRLRRPGNSLEAVPGWLLLTLGNS